MERIGDYKIEREVENGYEAEHVLLPRKVHLTVARPTFAGTRPAAMRMMREAFILEALQHAGVPRVYETGILVDGRIQRPWVATELVAGVSLAESAEAGETLTLRELVDLLEDVAEILAHAHASCFAHRRIRPETIVRRTGPRAFPVCLTSWGDAAILGQHEHADLAFADDVLALGVVADAIMESLADVPESLRSLVDAMTSTDLTSRPSASAVMHECDAIRAALDRHEPDSDVDVDIDLDDLLDADSVAGFTRPAASIPPPIPAASRMRWTPPTGYEAVVAPIERAESSARRG